MDTLQEEKNRLRAEFEKGTICKCCGSSVKMYKRKLNSGMALFLIGLYKLKAGFHSNKEVMSKMNINTSSLDYSVLKHFGLIESRVSEYGKKDSGYWRLTKKGLDFVALGTTVNKHVYIYKNKLQKVSTEETTIKEALGDSFDYKELMK